MPDKALEYFTEASQLVPEGSPVEEEIEEEIYNIYIDKLENQGKDGFLFARELHSYFLYFPLICFLFFLDSILYTCTIIITLILNQIC